MTQSNQPADLAKTAEAAARAAGAVAIKGFRTSMQIRSKGGKDIVTEYDHAAEAAALAVIRTHYPDHAILAEESGLSEQPPTPTPHSALRTPHFLWTVDPIDGTHNYAMQLPFWCTSVAVADAQTGAVLAGVVFDALHDELFSATLGGGAHLNGSPIHVTHTPAYAQAVLAYDIGYQPEIARRMLALAGWVQPQVQRIRLMGSAVLALAYVAAGRFDSYFHLSLQPWDIAAASLLVAEAGGAITDWHGNPIRAAQTSAVAANPTLQPQVLALLHAGEKGGD